MKIKKDDLLNILYEKTDLYLNKLEECGCKCKESINSEDVDEINEEELDEQISAGMKQLIKTNLAKQGGYVQKVGDKIVGRPFVNVKSKIPKSYVTNVTKQ